MIWKVIPTEGVEFVSASFLHEISRYKKIILREIIFGTLYCSSELPVQKKADLCQQSHHFPISL